MSPPILPPITREAHQAAIQRAVQQERAAWVDGTRQGEQMDKRMQMWLILDVLLVVGLVLTSIYTIEAIGTLKGRVAKLEAK